MNIFMTARHYELAPALRDYAENKVQHLKRFSDHIVKAHVVFSLEKYRHTVEITLHANGRDFVSIEESDDMYASLDRSVEKLESQLRRHKGRINRRKTNKSLSEASADAIASQDNQAETDESEEFGA